MAYENLSDMAALARRDMVQTVKQFRPAKARTLSTFEEGTRQKQAQLAGIQIPYVKSYAEGSGSLNPHVGATSFAESSKESFGAMFGGVVFRYMHLDLEASILLDLERGKLPDDYLSKRRRRIETYQMEKNWAAIGKGNGTVAVAASAAGSTLTCKADNSARGTSKGTFRLFITEDTTKPIYYSAINAGTDAEVARFYVAAKPTLTTATVAGFTVGNIAALNVAGLEIVKTKVGWKKEIIGIAGHISDANDIYQGADRATEPYLKNVGIDGGNVGVTPTMIEAAKEVGKTRSNNLSAGEGFVCHLSNGNFAVLKNYGYTNRTYNAEGGKARITFGLPDEYVDGDTVFVKDPDYEDAFIDFREKAPYFMYVQKEFGLHKTDGVGRHEWIGANQMGSTESYENYTESCNIVWDARGKDADIKGGGSPNSAVFIYNLALPAIRQTTYGIG